MEHPHLILAFAAAAVGGGWMAFFPGAYLACLKWWFRLSGWALRRSPDQGLTGIRALGAGLLAIAGMILLILTMSE